MVPLTIVIPNGRVFPSALVAALARQTREGDEVRVVRNHRPRAGRHWLGVGSGAGEEAPAEHPGVHVLASELGAAAARNVGWRSAANDWVVFLDDDVEVPAGFLDAVRQRLAERPTPRVVTFRVLGTSEDPTIATLAAFVPLDRGGKVYRTPAEPVPLDEVWQYGVGAALAAHRSVLETLGGFREPLGAGRRNGGSEDLELLWHASRHAEVEYRGDVALEHRPAPTVRLHLLKWRQYGKAMAALAGTAKGRDGLRVVVHFCRHMARLTGWCRQAGVSDDALRRIRVATTLAIVEAAQVYVASLLLRRRSGVGCAECRRRAASAGAAPVGGEADQTAWRTAR